MNADLLWVCGAVVITGLWLVVGAIGLALEKHRT